jgi:hypothetical protein
MVINRLIDSIEQIQGFFGNEGFAGIVAVETDRFRFGIIFDTAVIFDGNAVHKLGNQFEVIVYVIDSNDVHRYPP